MRVGFQVLSKWSIESDNQLYRDMGRSALWEHAGKGMDGTDLVPDMMVKSSGIWVTRTTASSRCGW